MKLSSQTIEALAQLLDDCAMQAHDTLKITVRQPLDFFRVSAATTAGSK